MCNISNQLNQFGTSESLSAVSTQLQPYAILHINLVIKILKFFLIISGLVHIYNSKGIIFHRFGYLFHRLHHSETDTISLFTKFYTDKIMFIIFYQKKNVYNMSNYFGQTYNNLLINK